MNTIDIHTHLLNPRVRFDRLFHRISAAGRFQSVSEVVRAGLH